MSQAKRRRVLDLSAINGRVTAGQRRGRQVPPNSLVSRDPARANRKARGRTGHRPGIMNGLEARYAEFLQDEVLAGRVDAYLFEGHKLLINDDPRVWWTPDFEVRHADGRIEFVDTKGKEHPAQQLKIKIAASKHSAYYFTKVKWERGQWVRIPIKTKSEVTG
jgi:hypothetical protein